MSSFCFWGVFRAFHPDGRLRAVAAIHVDDARYGGDETASDELWEALHVRLKFGKLCKATDGWQKFCGRWEGQDLVTKEMEYLMKEYTAATPLARTRCQRQREGAGDTSKLFVGATILTSYSQSIIVIAHTTTPATSQSCPATTTEAATDGDRVQNQEQFVELIGGERNVIGSIIGQINWAAQPGRNDLAFAASLVQQLAQLAGQGTSRAKRRRSTGSTKAESKGGHRLR